MVQRHLRSYLDTYTVDQRKAWYGTVADAYNRFRPRYPQALIDQAIEAAHLPIEKQVGAKRWKKN